ncbi:MAG: class II aldolase/adducin family protein, partial [Treponema sp.]|nr:class II aldolase/adducin family protein [Treponema sp.]
LYVKASGTSLAQATEDSFVKMDRKTLSNIWKKSYSDSSDEREKEVLQDLMAARKEGEGQKRPSVEALLHDIIPYAFIVHLHPALVNGLCCSQSGEEAAREIFGINEVLWIPSTNPGYILSRLVKLESAEYFKKHQKYAPVILLQNHGIFAGADTADGIKKIYEEVMAKIGARVKKHPDFSDETRIFAGKTNGGSSVRSEIKEILDMLSALAGSSCFMQSSAILNFLKDQKAFYPVSSAFTPDHIVYSGSDPLFTAAKDTVLLKDEWNNRIKKTNRNPKIVAVKDLGVFSAAATEKAACFACDLFKDTVKVAVYCENFQGPLFMSQDKIDFINNWEVERFRSSVSTT